MKHCHRIAVALSAATLAVSLSACAQLSQLTGGDSVGKQILTNLEGCDRHYTGAIGAGVNGSFEITCKAQAAAVTK